jgi:hypothetical protein
MDNKVKLMLVLSRIVSVKITLYCATVGAVCAELEIGGRKLVSDNHNTVVDKLIPEANDP